MKFINNNGESQKEGKMKDYDAINAEHYEKSCKSVSWIVYEAKSMLDQFLTNCENCKGGCSKCHLKKMTIKSVKSSMKQLKKAKDY